MAITAYMPTTTIKEIAEGDYTVDWDNGSWAVKAMLVKSAYTPDRATHDFIDDVSTHEISGTGYTAGGKALTGKAVTVSGTKVILDADDLSWTGATFSGANAVRYVVLYHDTGTPSTSRILGIVDLETSREVTAGTFNVNWDADGALKFTGV
jgi:hypothetical protein